MLRNTSSETHPPHSPDSTSQPDDPSDRSGNAGQPSPPSEADPDEQEQSILLEGPMSLTAGVLTDVDLLLLTPLGLKSVSHMSSVNSNGLTTI